MQACIREVLVPLYNPSAVASPRWAGGPHGKQHNTRDRGHSLEGGFVCMHTHSNMEGLGSITGGMPCKERRRAAKGRWRLIAAINL